MTQHWLVHLHAFGLSFRAPPKWFDEEPIGRLLNRLSDDIFCIDEGLPHAFHTHILIISEEQQQQPWELKEAA